MTQSDLFTAAPSAPPLINWDKPGAALARERRHYHTCAECGGVIICYCEREQAQRRCDECEGGEDE